MKIYSSKNRTKKGLLLGGLIGLLGPLFTRKPKPTQSDLQKADFRTSTRKMGLNFTDKLRNHFRTQWLRKN
ncbi:hypothetical protein STSP2_00535 [Anaerohalosphaera lusitana]|uniref:Uncharacterized protein n=1 Tax=Anaerohalosphaera lusitana TaxID=1936003 RepID=A0A1U9NHJ4_9BACT|nr:hypothetical protein [Anaerohalosphaera lusitana]AQT67391.1 hypothetical protein STSP2_00535 [Anaerohalosphaera lusitana]